MLSKTASIRRRDHRTHRHIAAGKRLGHADDIRFYSGPVLVREPFAGAAQAALNLIGHQRRAGFAAKPPCLRQIAVGRDLASLSLHRFHDESGRVLLPQRLLQRFQVVEGNLRSVRHQISEPLPEEIRAVERKGAYREPVKGMIAEQDPLLSGKAAGKLNGRLDAFRTGVAEEHARQIAPGRSSGVETSFSATRPASREQSMRTRLGMSRERTCSKIDLTRG